ncbi:MAG: sugar kinase [Paenibacillus dendritiformis]|uniref:sugar kinase n=1 Tax=uncultured Paenibacillus sp. TaxID=227322 RepID=UPI0025CB7A54|nr:sugar kinase [uncultured Paenibacillus sp.]MDU5141289.1 sugar kinase [Paenibacillus dendritiformis]
MKALSEKNPEVVTFGESMALFSSADTRGLEYAQTVMKSFGGAESNVAIGLARLGHRAGWCGRLGRDPFGRNIVKAIRGEGVDVSRVGMDPDAPTGLMMRELVAGKSSVYYYRAGSAASRMAPRHLDKDYIRSARLLHVTGITCALSDSCAETVYEAVSAAKAAGVKVSFDPNLRLKLWTIEEAREKLLPLAREADYFLPGLDELKLLYGTEDEPGIFRRLSELPGVSIVKGGPGINYVVQGSRVDEVPYEMAEHVVDTVGAGDAFCAGFLSGILQGTDAAEAVRLGNITGAMVVQAFGDWEALPTAEQLQGVLNRAVHIER